MNQKYIRVFKKVDMDDVREHMLICGDLSASCSKCNAVGLKTDIRKCSECQTEFKYITFRNIKENLPKIQKLNESDPQLIIVDYDDFKKMTGKQRAQEFFK